MKDDTFDKSIEDLNLQIQDVMAGMQTKLGIEPCTACERAARIRREAAERAKASADKLGDAKLPDAPRKRSAMSRLFDNIGPRKIRVQGAP